MVLIRNRAQVSHQATLGKLTKVYLAALDLGVAATAIVDQVIFINGGYQQTVTVATAAAGLYQLTALGQVIATYTATSGDTVASIRNGLLASVKAIAQTGILTPAIWAGNPTTGAFTLISQSTFTATSTGATPANVTLGTTALATGTAPTVGGTSLTLFEPLLGPVYAGQYLCFADVNDLERLVKVTQTAATGATTLTVAPLAEAPSTGSAAEFPAYLWDRTDASLDEAYATTQVVTFNTGGAQLQIPTTIDRKITLPGIFYHYNAAYRTAHDQADSQKLLYCRREQPAPTSAFVTGDVIYGVGIVTSNKNSGAANSPIASDLEFSFSGATVRTNPVTALGYS